MMLENKVAVVTGAARGIGREIALCFAREGADVVLCDLDGEELHKVRGEVKALGRKSLAFDVDVRKSEEVKESVNKIIDSLGRIDILVNNAGITKDGFLIRMSEEDWDIVIDVNLKGTFNFTKAVIKPMIKKRAGRIINVSSVVGLHGNAGQTNYAASKAGIVGFTKSVAKELAPRGIKVNAIAPGMIKTRMTDMLSEEARQKWLDSIPLGYLGAPSDIAKVALFLASDLATYITGQVIAVDGGMTM